MVADQQIKTNVNFAIVLAECFTTLCGLMEVKYRPMKKCKRRTILGTTAILYFRGLGTQRRNWLYCLTQLNDALFE